MPASKSNPQKVQKKNIYTVPHSKQKILYEMIVCVVDIETTGLNEKQDLITAIGVIIYESDKREKQFEHCYNVCLARANGLQSETELKKAKEQIRILEEALQINDVRQLALCAKDLACEDSFESFQNSNHDVNG